MARISFEVWDPSYGVSMRSDELAESDASIEPGIEVRADRWKPLAPAGAPEREDILFIDGVRRIDARLWLHGIGRHDPPGRLCVLGGRRDGRGTPCEAGHVRGAARTLLQHRSRFASDIRWACSRSPSPRARRRTLSRSRFKDSFESWSGRLHATTGTDGRLLVVDGPLSTRHKAEASVGYIKTHRVHYLDAALERTVFALGPGERTPLFSSRRPGTVTRATCDCLDRIRIRGRALYGWRCPGNTPWRARALSSTDARNSSRGMRLSHIRNPGPRRICFQSPGLERELRHRLGDPALIHRAH